jgi:signal peptidase II
MLAFSLVLGGGLSNLLDRITYGGYVVDFIKLGIGPLQTGIFNAADVAITIGVLLVVFGGQWQRKPSASNSPTDR